MAASGNVEREALFRIGRQAARDVFVKWALARVETHRRSPQLSLLDVSPSEQQGLAHELAKRVTFASSGWGIFPAAPHLYVTDISGSERDTRLLNVVQATESEWYSYSTFDLLVYLGPLRRPPERFHMLSGARRTNVETEGEFTAELLSRREDLVTDVNHWLERLAIPYAIDAILIEGEGVRHSMGDVVVLVLTDQRNDLHVSPGDVGFGISQLLPIVVQALVGKATTICVEQPEIHVHPALQTRMADLFIEAVSERRRNQMIIETHSEHMMLRLQKRIREGSLDHRSVQILDVDVDSAGQSFVVPIGLAADGGFLKFWPAGVFEERFDELFSK